MQIISINIYVTLFTLSRIKKQTPSLIYIIKIIVTHCIYLVKAKICHLSLCYDIKSYHQSFYFLQMG